MLKHDIQQLHRFEKLILKYGKYERVNNLCIFRGKGKATSLNIDMDIIPKQHRRGSILPPLPSQ